MKLTTRIKLHTDIESKQALLKTMLAFNAACQNISEYAFTHKIFNKHNLQDRLYQQIRSEFKLPAQLTIRAFAKVDHSYRSERELFKKRTGQYERLSPQKQVKHTRPEFRQCNFKNTGSVVYDSRLLAYQPNNRVSLRCLSKRLILDVDYSPCHNRDYIKGEADLVFQDNVFYLLQTIDVPEPPLSDVSNYIGVDLGIVHLAVDSEGHVYDNPQIESKRQSSEKRDKALKQIKTKNSRRRLKSMSKRQRRFQTDINHCISKALVQKTKALNKGLAMENLVNFFDKTKVRRTYRAARHSWAFRQLRMFVQYKALQAGVPYMLVNPAYTSQECSECSFIDKRNRKTQSMFLCLDCGHTENADFNASKTIRNRAAVNQPEALFKRSEAATMKDLSLSCSVAGYARNASAASPSL